jgi:integrase
MKLRVRTSKAKSLERRPTPSTENGTVPPRRVENTKRRPREYLTVKEITKLMEGARERGRYGHRDATMVLVAYRHGLRVSELCALRWDQVDFERGLLHVRRVKNGTPSVHPLGGTELRSLRRLMREQPELRMSFLRSADIYFSEVAASPKPTDKQTAVSLSVMVFSRIQLF